MIVRGEGGVGAVHLGLSVAVAVKRPVCKLYRIPVRSWICNENRFRYDVSFQ